MVFSLIKVKTVINTNCRKGQKNILKDVFSKINKRDAMRTVGKQFGLCHGDKSRGKTLLSKKNQCQPIFFPGTILSMTESKVS